MTANPVLHDPDCGPYVTDDDGRTLEDGVGWDLSGECRVSFEPAGDRLDVTVSTSGDEQRRGITVRAATAEQVRNFAHKLLALAGDGASPAPDTEETAR